MVEHRRGGAERYTGAYGDVNQFWSGMPHRDIRGPLVAEDRAMVTLRTAIGDGVV
jgi:hypothetical protein